MDELADFWNPASAYSTPDPTTTAAPGAWSSAWAYSENPPAANAMGAGGLAQSGSLSDIFGSVTSFITAGAAAVTSVVNATKGAPPQKTAAGAGRVAPAGGLASDQSLLFVALCVAALIFVK